MIQAVVGLIPIYMMNYFTLAKFPSKLLFCSPAMYQDIGIREPHVAFVVYISIH